MGVIQVATRPRTQLPPGQTGVAKPPYQLADRSGEQAAYGMIGSVAGGILNKVIQAQENEQVSTFEGSYDAEVVKFNGLVRANPGASEQQVQKWMKGANSNIQKAGEIPTNRNAKVRVRNTIKGNLPAFNERMQANWAAIESKRLLDNLNDEIENAVQSLDKPRLEKAISEASGNLIDPEQRELLLEKHGIRIDRLAEGVARQAEANLEEARSNTVYEEAITMSQKDGFALILLEPDEDVRRIAKARLTEYHRIRLEKVESDMTRSYAEGTLSKPLILNADLPSARERAWLDDMKTQYDEGPPETDDNARRAVNDAIDLVGGGRLSSADAIKTFNANKHLIKKDERKSFIDEIEQEKDKVYSSRRQVGNAMLGGMIKGPQNSLGVYYNASEETEYQYSRATTMLATELLDRKIAQKPVTDEDLYAMSAKIANQIKEQAGPKRLIEEEDFTRIHFVPPLKSGEEPIPKRYFQGAPPSLGEFKSTSKKPDKKEALAANDNLVYTHLQTLKTSMGKSFPKAGEEFVKTQLEDLNDVWPSLNNATKRYIIEVLLEDPSISDAGKQFHDAIINRRKK